MASSFVTGTIGSRLNGHQNGGGFNCYQISKCPPTVHSAPPIHLHPHPSVYLFGSRPCVRWLPVRTINPLTWFKAGIHPPAAGNGISHGIFSCPNNGGDCVSGSSRPHSSTDEQSGFNADGMMRQLFPENDRDSGAHRRAFTPTEEQLTMSLHRLGMDAPDDLAAGDILDLARRGLARSQAVSGSPSRAMPCNGNEGLSDSHSNGATTPGDPMTPVMSPSDLARGSPFSADRGTFSGQGGPNVVRKMHPTGAGSHPHEKRGLVDLYAPMGIQGLGCHPNWDSEQPTNPKDPRNSPNYGITFPALGQYTENPHVVFQNPHRMVSPRRSSPPISGAQFVQNELMQEIERLKRLAHDLSIRNQEYKTKYDYACHVGVQTILIREGEIGELKQQLRKADILPFNEQFTADDSCYENELMMCFRMLCCWGKRFYKFPTSMSLPRPLQIRISEICEDTHSEAFLMNSPQSKYLVVVALATRWLAEEILNTHFLSIVVSGFNGNENGLKEMLDGVKGKLLLPFKLKY